MVAKDLCGGHLDNKPLLVRFDHKKCYRQK